MANLDIYNAVRKVPAEAQKKISGGRLNGKTDINPVWRIKALTELFGACGIGWKYEIVRLWLEQGAKDETAAFSEIKLYIKNGTEWSDGIPGIGGSMFIATEKSGLYTSDECYKMATTDALSVACKALGVGADIYWEADKSKYDKPVETPPPPAPKTPPTTATPQKITPKQGSDIFVTATALWGDDAKDKLIEIFKIEKLSEVTAAEYAPIMAKLERLKDGTNLG
jgi:hypothetical protein